MCPTLLSILGLDTLGNGTTTLQILLETLRPLTRSCSLLLPVEALSAFHPSPPWNSPFPSVDLTLATPRSRSKPPLSFQGAALAHFDYLSRYDLVIWNDGSVPFLICIRSAGVLTIVRLRPLFPIWQAQCVQAFLLKPAPF